MFWFKRKEIIVDCFIDNSTIEQNFPIEPAHKFFPEGWKTIPKTMPIKVHEKQYPESNLSVDMATIKKCVGLINLFSNGFIIPAWCDLGVEMDAKGNHLWHAPMNMHVMQHPSFQLWDGLYKDYGHVKLGSPWVIHEKTGVNFTWNQCDWNNTDDLHKYRIVSGVLDFKYQHQSNVNMFLRKSSLIDFKAGDPLVHLIPISESNVKIKTHVVDTNELMKLNTNQVQYVNQYRTTKSKIDAKERKCPFGFGK